MREIRWSFIVCGLESEKSKLKFDVPLNWQPVEFSKCVDRIQIEGFCATVLAAAFWTLCKRVLFLAGELNKMELA